MRYSKAIIVFLIAGSLVTSCWKKSEPTTAPTTPDAPVKNRSDQSDQSDRSDQTHRSDQSDRTDRSDQSPPTTPTLTSPPKQKKASGGPIAPPRRDVPGRRFQLPLGQLYVPDFFDPKTGPATDVTIFFHGAAWCSEQNFHDARKNSVLVSISVKDYGYDKVFSKPEALSDVLNATTTTLAHEGVCTKTLGRLCISSFSGGYSAIREILKHPRYTPLITDVVLADSLYGPRDPGNPNAMDPKAMAPFLDYARRAVSGKCSFWFTQLYPPEEKDRTNTTTVAAYYLTDHLEVKRLPASTKNSAGAVLLYRADKNGFHVLGYSGMTTQDHFNHFYAICDLWRETSLSTAEKP